MIYECAPMDGVTDFVFRQVQSRHFRKADRYFTPFLSLTVGHGFQEHEHNEMAPEHNRGLCVVPQLIGCDSRDFLWGAKEAMEYGYDHVNLNMGCPSKTVVRKGKGSGMLKDREKLERFLEEIYSRTPVAVSLKTRIGYEDPDEFPALLELLNRYPVKELIIHPRVQPQGYAGEIEWKWWDYAKAHALMPISYSGDLFDEKKVHAFEKDNAGIEAIMIGRGLVANPALVGQLRGDAPLDNERLREYHEDLLEGYRRLLPKDRMVIGKMKEMWAYMGRSFAPGIPELAELRRAVTMEEYRIAAERLISECPVRQNPGFCVKCE